VAENLWALREQKQLSVAALANRSGLPINLILEYESGQRSIDPRHLSRLARVLYVEEAQIKLQSDPRPGAAPLERPAPREGGRAPADQPLASPAKPKERAPRPRLGSRPPTPPRPSQIAHLENLLQRLGRTKEELEAELNKPIAGLDRSALSDLLRRLQAQLAASTSVNRRRAYLPESVDEFEARYLTAAQEAGDVLRFTLFDGSSVEGQVIGFGPYSITVRLADGSELTVNKLALVSYRKAPLWSGGAEEQGGRGAREQRSGGARENAPLHPSTHAPLLRGRG
jgi:transcriptional regulator with XRE-family HTH domain